MEARGGPARAVALLPTRSPRGLERPRQPLALLPRRVEAAAGSAPDAEAAAAAGKVGGRVVSSRPTPSLGAGYIECHVREPKDGSSLLAAGALPVASGKTGIERSPSGTPPRAGASGIAGSAARRLPEPTPRKAARGLRGWEGRVPSGRRAGWACGRAGTRERSPRLCRLEGPPPHPAVRRRCGRVGRPQSPPRWGAQRRGRRRAGRAREG